jgi:mono/diheme cytochrome c family protein
MARAFLNLVLFAAFGGLLALNVLSARDMRQRNYEFMPNMAHSVPYQTYAPNPNMPDGKTLQAPEPDTIARGQMPLHYGSTPPEAIRAGAELVNPFSAADSGARERGAAVYGNYCQMCHGPQGKGDGPVLERGLPPPASLLGERAVQMKDGQIFHVLTYGQGNMASYAAQLPREDRWHVILHVRSLQQQFAGKGAP